MGDEHLYLTASKEFDEKIINEALWAKAMALAEGDTVKAKYKYINLRVEKLSSSCTPVIEAVDSEEQKNHEISRERLIDLFNKYMQKDKTVDWMSYNCPITEEIIERYKDDLDWRLLSSNYDLTWTLSFIKKYQKRFTWGLLSKNSKLPWSLELLAHYKDRWNWDYLSENPALPWSFELIELYDEGDFSWDWTRLSENPELPWSIELLDHFKDRWEWNYLSKNPRLPVFFKIDGTVSVLKRRLFLPHTFPDSMSLAQRARNF